MSVSITYVMAAILISAFITFGLRALPFIAFRGERKMPEFLRHLGEVLPAAIMAVLIIYCLRGARSDFAGVGIPGIIAVIVTGISYKWRHNTFLSIIIGTAVYMLLIRLI